jgi:NAD(P)-dependent dehydrogenase (short-subunit alcohol dehydrogenase family)
MLPTVLVTGASSGIGAATARLLADRGFRVFGTSRDPEGLTETAGHVSWLALDVRDDESVEKAIAQVLDSSGRLDALVCNAGSGIFGSVEEVPMSTAIDQIDTNLLGVLRTVRTALPPMREAGRGRIVLVGSLAGRAPIPFQAHYSASKAAVDALALALRNELHPFGVAVSLVEPGDINTPFNEATVWSGTGESPYGERLKRSEQVIRERLPRSPGPEMVAGAIHRALTARRPRVRYTVGPESWMVPIGRRLLPDWLMLRFIRQHFDV